MNKSIEERTLHEANYMLKHRGTIRKVAKDVGTSKSTVHLDLTQRLQQISPALAKDIRALLDKNKANRHFRGGDATKRYWSKVKRLRSIAD